MKYISVLFTVIILFASVLAKAEENLILNPGFEIKGPLTGDGETRYWVEDDDAKYWDEVAHGSKRSNLSKHRGKWSLNSWGGNYIEEHGAWQGDDNSNGQTQFIPIIQGTQIVFTAYLMSPNGEEIGKSPLSGGAEAFIEIEWSGTSPVESVQSDYLTGTSNGKWKLYLVSGTAPPGTTAVRFVLKVICVPGSSGDVYFDDLKAVIVSEIVSLY